MEFLVRTFAIVNSVSDTGKIAKYNRADTFRLAVFDELRRLFVEGVFDLVINLSDTLPLPACESPPAFGMAFTTTDRLTELGDQHFVSVAVQ